MARLRLSALHVTSEVYVCLVFLYIINEALTHDVIEKYTLVQRSFMTKGVNSPDIKHYHMSMTDS